MCASSRLPESTATTHSLRGEAPADEKGTWLYVGVTAPGTSQTTLLVRTYAALLQAAQELEGSDTIKDPYWTLVGYFNSLRVLGGARMQVQDDVNDRLELLMLSTGYPNEKSQSTAGSNSQVARRRGTSPIT